MDRLLDFRFLVGHVLAHDRIVFFDLEPLGSVLLVLRRVIHVRALGAFELDVDAALLRISSQEYKENGKGETEYKKLIFKNVSLRPGKKTFAKIIANVELMADSGL